jgi:hypothetical protein
MTFVSSNPLPVEIEEKMERFEALGQLMRLANRVADYARTHRHLLRQELKRLCAVHNTPAYQ